jgi:hypothetical protein
MRRDIFKQYRIPPLLLYAFALEWDCTKDKNNNQNNILYIPSFVLYSVISRHRRKHFARTSAHFPSFHTNIFEICTEQQNLKALLLRSYSRQYKFKNCY